MSALPSVREKNNYTDWVIATARTTEIDAYLLWRLKEQQSETDLLDWVEEVTAYSEVTQEELVLAVNRINREGTMPDVAPAPISVERVIETPDNETNTDEETTADTDEETTVESPDFEEGPRFADLTDKPDRSPAADSPALDDTQPSPQQDPPQGETVVTAREYQQFQEKVQEVVQNLIDFLISYDMLSGDDNGGRPEIERELKQAAEQADDAPEFFRQIESILTQRENEHDIDLTEFRRSVEQENTTNTEESAQFIDELKSSIAELRQLQDDIEASSRASTEREEQTPESNRSSRMTDLSRNDDPRVLGNLNRLAQTIQDRIDETVTTDKPEPDDATPEETEEVKPEQDGGVEIDATDTDEPSASSGGAVSGSAVGFATEDKSDRGYDPRAALFPIDIGWGLASLIYGGFDMFSTILVLGNGGQELNPLYSLLGESVAAFVIWKTLVLFALFILFYPDDPGEPSTTEWLIPIGTAIVGVILTINNLSVLAGGGGLI
jgi:hypothetical protein